MQFSAVSNQSNECLPKPTPTRPGLAVPVQSNTTPIPRGSYHKPSDPALESLARKSLLLLSRRKGEQHPGQVLAEAASYQRRTQQHQQASVFVGQELTSPIRTSAKHGSKIVPIGGMRNGVFLFTGIVMRRDGRYRNGEASSKVAFIKLDNPNGSLDGVGHVVR